MDFFNSFEHFFKQLSELQRITLNNWGTTMSHMQSINLLNSPENFERTVKLQEELLKNSWEFQEQVSRLSIDTQRKIWNSYFQMLRR